MFEWRMKRSARNTEWRRRRGRRYKRFAKWSVVCEYLSLRITQNDTENDFKVLLYNGSKWEVFLCLDDGSTRDPHSSYRCVLLPLPPLCVHVLCDISIQSKLKRSLSLSHSFCELQVLIMFLCVSWNVFSRSSTLTQILDGFFDLFHGHIHFEQIVRN